MPRPQLWIKRMALTVDDSSVALPFPSDDPPELTRHFADAPQILAGSIRRFRVDLDTATAVGDWRFRVFKNGTGTVLDLTIPQGSTTIGATADTDVVTFSQFDLLRIDIDASTGSATAKPWTFTMEYTPTTAGARAYGGGHLNFFGDASDASLTYKMNPCFPRTVTWGDDTLAEFKTEHCAIGQDGTITNTLIYYQVDITAAGAYEFKLWKCPAGSDPSVIANFVAQDGSGGTVDTRSTLDASSPTIADSTSTARSYVLGSFSLPVSEGDFIFITAKRTSGTTDPNGVGLRAMVLLAMTATDTTKWFISGAGLALGGVFANYIAPIGNRVLIDSSTTTTGINVGPFGANGAIFTGAIFWVEDDPNTGNDRAFELYNAGVVTDIVATISGTAKTANDNGSATVTSGNAIYIKHTPTSGPDDNVRVWFTYFGTSVGTFARSRSQWY